MSNQEHLAELLLKWQESQAQGTPQSLAELCMGNASLEAELANKVEALQAMEWMEKVNGSTTKQGNPTGSKSWGKTWVVGQEPVPGYRLVKPLGRGGFSEVWQAEGPSGIPVAMKLVFADRSSLEEQALQLLKTLRHPRIVSIFGAWAVENGFALAMELADESLHERWARISSDAEAVAKLSQAALQAGAEAMDFLNISHHIQHRDVKPQNLLMFGNYIKLADFGIAKVVEDHSTGHTGYFTVAYAAPEFFRGRSASTSDQYSLAVMYTQLRSGKLPFVGNSAAMTYGHLHSAPKLDGLPIDERSAVARALSKEPRDRWPSCQAFAEAVRSKKKVFLQPRTRRQLLVGAAAVAVGTASYLTWPGSKPVSKPIELRLRRRFDKPLGMEPKEGLFLRQVAGTKMADRSTGQMDKYDYYVLGNGMKGVFLWDGYTGKLVKNLIPEPGISVAFPNNELRKCMTGDNNGCFYRWDIAKLALLFKHAGHAPTQQVTSIDYTTDTYRFVTASTDRTIKLWEPSTQAAGTLAPQTTIKTPAYTMQAKLLPNGKTIVSAGYDGTVHLWDAQTSVKKKSIDVSNAPLWTLDVSLDGRFALAGGDDQLVSLIDLSTGQLVKQFEGHEAKVEFVSFTANKEFVCSCASDKTLRFWNITSGREEQRATHDSEVFGISPAYYRMNGDVHLTATTETVYAWESISKE